MKKLVLLALALVIALSLAACGGNSNSGNNSTNPPASQGNNNSTTTPPSSTPDSTPSGNDNVEWPDNEFTQKVPKPSLEVKKTSQVGRDFTIDFTDATYDNMKAYVAELEAAGYVKGSGITDIPGDTLMWNGTNADGWIVAVTVDKSYGSMIITKPA